MTAGQNKKERKQTKDIYNDVASRMELDCETTRGWSLFYSLVLRGYQTGVFETLHIINKYVKNTSRH